MLADTPLPRGSGANLAVVGTLSEGFRRIVAAPPLPRRLRAMGRTVWSFLLVKQSCSAASDRTVPQNVPYASSRYAPMWAFSILQQSASVRA